jgi:ankyrin repeat protein
MDGHEIDPVDESGWTPLLRSCSIEGSVQVAQALLGHKAKVDVEDNEKLNPLTIAIINNNLFMVKLLVENRADFLKPNSNGKTPYELADSMEKKVTTQK